MASASTWTRLSVRFVVAVCLIALLGSALVWSAQPVAASNINDRIASVRAAQQYAQSAMRTQDRAIERLKAQRKAVNKSLKQAERGLNAQRSALAAAKSVLQERVARLARVEAEVNAPNPDPEAEAGPVPASQKLRLQTIRKEVRIAEARKANIARREQAMLRAVRSKKSQIQNLVRQRKVAVNRRESAEASLSASIKQMRVLAAIKAEEQATVSLSSGDAFSWPSAGRITQRYGCTGFKFNPRKGSCKHFHDGIDVVSSYGSPVRSVAVGVVAYAGWNPYDQEGRAYVVDVVHPDGMMSRYGHLVATNLVRAGELVYTGKVIGKMGSTGKSTGTHLHFELLINDKDVNPVAYLPAGVVRIVPSSTKAGQAELSRREKEQAKKKAKEEAKMLRALIKKAQQQARKELAQERREAAKSRTRPSSTLIACVPAESDGSGNNDSAIVECDPNAPPGIPLPYHGTSPAPA